MKTIAIIGVGYWGPYLLRNAMAVPGITVKSVCDTNPEHLTTAVQRYPGLHTTDSFYEIISDDDIEAVIISTPAGLHYSHTRACLTAGKDVFIEKPLALTLPEASELVEIADTQNRLLMVGHTFLYNAAVRKMKSLLLNKQLGELYFIISQRMSLGRVRDDVNVLWNLAPHDYSILLYLKDRTPRWVNACGASYLQHKNEDVVFATLGFNDGTMANVQLNWLNPIKVRRMLLVGKERMLVYDDVSPDEKLTLYDRSIEIEEIEEPSPHASFSEFQATVRRGEARVIPLEFPEPLRIEIEHFARCLDTRETPLTDGRHALEVMKLLEATQRSISSGKREKV